LEQCCFFLALLLRRQHQRRRGDAAFYQLFRSHQLSLGLYHAGGVWEEGDGVGGGCFIGFNYSLLNSISIAAVLLIVDILYFYPMIKTNKIKIFYLRCSRN
jgi:hypothetical protein